MPLPWSKRSIIKATEGLLDSSTSKNSYSNINSSSTFSQLLRGKGKRVHTEVQVIPYPCLPSSTDDDSTEQHFSYYDTITNNPSQEEVNDWEVEIVPVPPKPASSRTISFSKRRFSPEMTTTMMMSSQDKRCKAVEQEVHSVASEAVVSAVPKNNSKAAVLPAPNHFFNCVVIADGILTDATETVLNMIVNTITAADDVCTCASTAVKTV